jgi:hypothetical protein
MDSNNQLKLDFALRKVMRQHHFFTCPRPADKISQTRICESYSELHGLILPAKKYGPVSGPIQDPGETSFLAACRSSATFSAVTRTTKATFQRKSMA